MSKFLDDLDALVRSHSADRTQQDSEERVISSLSAVIVQAARAIVAELRGGSTAPTQRQAAMIRYRPDWDRGAHRGAAMIRYRPDWDRDPRNAAMIRYRPDWDRGAHRGSAMIRYRPDWDRDPRNAAMIRYRPDWDRQVGGDAAQAASGLLEPILKNLAERLGPGEAARIVQSSLVNMGLAQPEGAAAEPETDSTADKV